MQDQESELMYLRIGYIFAKRALYQYNFILALQYIVNYRIHI